MSRLSLLLSPVAIGIYLTCAFTYTAFSYFTAQGKDADSWGAVEQILITAHQKSIDYRLKIRGERSGSPQVALLTVDDKAVATVGRWPWPRDITAKAVDNAVKHGAKVLAFDIVFSEPSPHQSAEILKVVAEKTPLPENIRTAFEEEIVKRDSDKALAEVFQKNSGSLVLGSYGEFGYSAHTDQFDACMNMIFFLQPESKRWVENEKTPMVNMSQPPEIPETLKGVYLEALNQRSEELRKIRVVTNAVQDHELKSEIVTQQLQYCATWLTPEDETYAGVAEHWPVVAEAEGQDFLAKYENYDAWIATFINGTTKLAVPHVFSWTMNFPDLTSGTDGYHTGYFNAALDPDGTVRRSHLIARTGTTFMPSIALKGFLIANNYNAQIKLRYNARIGRSEIDKLEVINDEGEPVFDIPVDPLGRLAINYAGKAKIFPHVSLAELLTDSDEMSYQAREYDARTKTWINISKKVKKEAFLKDKVFIVGATAIGIYDLRVTPFEENFPGAETHANVLDNLIRRDFLVTHPNEELGMLIALFALGIILSIALSSLSALPGLTLVVALLAGITLIDRFYLFGQGTVVTIVLPLTLVAVLFMVLISYKYFTEERGKKELRNTFSKYVSPSIVNEILSDPSKIELGGRKERVTIFFSDVRGFTTISEKLDPRALSDLLNEYLTPMTDLVFKHRGTLDKYMGDAIMAFFGAPIPYSDHAKHAARCALKNLEKLYELQKEFKAKGLPSIDIGIGLNTGEVSVGNMGSQTVRSYTVMGDAVNLASRLEGTNKEYGTRIIISEFTYEDIKSDFICRELDWVRVKGKAQPVRIFELVAEQKTDVKTTELLKSYQEAYALYHSKQFARALEVFNKALNIMPEDPVTRLYIERCMGYIAVPPEGDWDGVFEMTTK